MLIRCFLLSLLLDPSLLACVGSHALSIDHLVRHNGTRQQVNSENRALEGYLVAEDLLERSFPATVYAEGFPVLAHSFTASMWVKTNALNEPISMKDQKLGRCPILIDASEAPAGQPRAFTVSLCRGVPSVNVWPEGVDHPTFFAFDSHIADGAWHHLAISYVKNAKNESNFVVLMVDDRVTFRQVPFGAIYFSHVAIGRPILFVVDSDDEDDAGVVDEALKRRGLDFTGELMELEIFDQGIWTNTVEMTCRKNYYSRRRYGSGCSSCLQVHASNVFPPACGNEVESDVELESAIERNLQDSVNDDETLFIEELPDSNADPSVDENGTFYIMTPYEIIMEIEKSEVPERFFARVLSKDGGVWQSYEDVCNNITNQSGFHLCNLRAVRPIMDPKNNTLPNNMTWVNKSVVKPLYFELQYEAIWQGTRRDGRLAWVPLAFSLVQAHTDLEPGIGCVYWISEDYDFGKDPELLEQDITSYTAATTISVVFALGLLMCWRMVHRLCCKPNAGIFRIWHFAGKRQMYWTKRKIKGRMHVTWELDEDTLNYFTNEGAKGVEDRTSKEQPLTICLDTNDLNENKVVTVDPPPCEPPMDNSSMCLEYWPMHEYNEVLEYWSPTHRRWVLATVIGDFARLPHQRAVNLRSITISLNVWTGNGTVHARSHVPLDCVRHKMLKNEEVEVERKGTWVKGRITEELKSGFYGVLLEHESKRELVKSMLVRRSFHEGDIVRVYKGFTFGWVDGIIAAPLREEELPAPCSPWSPGLGLFPTQGRPWATPDPSPSTSPAISPEHSPVSSPRTSSSPRKSSARKSSSRECSQDRRIPDSDPEDRVPYVWVAIAVQTCSTGTAHDNVCGEPVLEKVPSWVLSRANWDENDVQGSTTV